MTEQRPLRAVRPLGEGTPRALVAGADDLYRLGLARLLRGHGIDVVGQVPAAAAAVTELARDLQPDVVLLELRSRGAGVLAVARLRDLENPPNVLALSGAPHHAEAVEALCAGASGYLAKDTDAPTLAGAIRTLHAGEVLMPWFVADTVLAPLRESRPPANGHQLEGEPLTEREVEVLHLVARGMANEEIAENLVIAASTVKNHITRIVAKLGARNRTHAAVLAVHRRYV